MYCGGEFPRSTGGDHEGGSFPRLWLAVALIGDSPHQSRSLDRIPDRCSSALSKDRCGGRLLTKAVAECHFASFGMEFIIRFAVPRRHAEHVEPGVEGFERRVLCRQPQIGSLLVSVRRPG